VLGDREKRAAGKEAEMSGKLTLKYEMDCIFIEKVCASDNNYYAGQGDFHCWLDCGKNKMAHSELYARTYCPNDCAVYLQNTEDNEANLHPNEIKIRGMWIPR